MKPNHHDLLEPAPADTPFIERRAAVREVTGRALATREAARAAEAFHYPAARLDDALVPMPGDLVTLADPFCDRSEEFRALRTELLQSVFTPRHTRALAILSQDAGDGRSYVAANLAVSFSELGGDTLLLDADLRSPSLGTVLAPNARAGLAELLEGSAEESDAITGVPGVAGLHVLGAGHCGVNALRLLQGARMRVLMRDLIERFDHVIVDTPANTAGPDGRVVAVHAGAALIVGREGESRIGQLGKLVEQLGRSPAELAGIVLNRH